MREIRKEFKVPERRLDELKAGVEAINKRAAKLGCKPVFLTVGENRMVELPRKNQDDAPKYYKEFDVVVEGETPKLDGWNFVASLLHFYGDDVGNIIQGVPGVDVPKEYRDRGPVCDHCNKNRRRNKTFVLENDDGRFVQVGSTCLGDFFGRSADNPEALAALCEELNRFFGGLSDGDDGEGGGEGGGVLRSYLALQAFLANTVTSVREYGWLGRGKARETGREGCATADEVVNRLFATHTCRTDSEREELERLTPTKADRAEADAAIEWGKGTLAERKEAATSEHFGTEGEREVFKLRVTRRSSFEGHFGTTWVTGFQDEAGNQAVWFGSYPVVGEVLSNSEGDALVEHEAKIGDDLFVKATVKEHGEYKGGKQTVLTRCALTRYDPDDKGVKKVLRACRKAGRLFSGDYWEILKFHDGKEEKEAVAG